MKPLRVLLVLMLACLLWPAAAFAGKQRSAAQLLDQVDDLYRGKSAHGKMTMTVVHPKYRRTLTMEFWSKGTEKSLIRILEPKKERRTATLKNGNNIYNYLPKVDKTIKIPASMMGGSWMGSDFTNDDLVKEHRMAQDYQPRITAENQQEIEITCIPKPRAAVVWGKVVVKLRASDSMPLKILYHKEDGTLERRLEFSDIRDIGGRRIPTQMTMTPVNKRGHQTIVRYLEIEFDIGVPDSMFTVGNLRR
jgi:outer membrane lipoprotein-sorting protein